MSTKIKIGAEVGIPGLVKAHVEWCREQTKDATDKPNTTDDGKNSAQIGSSGCSAQIKCEGKNAVVACAGANNAVSAPVGTWVCLSEYGIVEGERVCVGMKAFRIDGKKYKANVWLALRDGKVVEVEERSILRHGHNAARAAHGT